MTIVDLPAATEALAEMDRLQLLALGPNASVGDVRRAVVRRQELEAVLDKFREIEAENARLKDRRFRIMGGPSIPWRMIAPHETQALANHAQTLEQLHGRGGLSPAEAVAVLEGKPYRQVRSMPAAEAERRLVELTRAFESPELMQPAASTRMHDEPVATGRRCAACHAVGPCEHRPASSWPKAEER